MPKSLGTIWIAQHAIDTMVAEADLKYPRETGGILMGYWSSVSECVISVATISGRYARHRRTEYEPDYEHDEVQIARYYEQSKPTMLRIPRSVPGPDSKMQIARR